MKLSQKQSVAALLSTPILGVGLFFIITLVQLPSPSEIIQIASGSNRFLLDDNDQVIQKVRVDHKKRRQVWLPLNSFSQEIRQAVIQVEDKRFYDHWGVDFLALARAIKVTLTTRRIQGASTLSMQTADLIDRKVLLEHEPIVKGSVFAKIRQIVRGFSLDLKWSKQEILEAYLNLVHLKGETQGVHSVSQLYLAKSPRFLNTAESYLLAALIKAPNRNAESLVKRACRLAKRQNKDTDCKKMDAPLARLFSGTKKNNESQNIAPHLARRLFQAQQSSQPVQTHINKDLQQKVYAILQKNLSYLQNRNVHDAAAVVIENKTGNLLAYVGAIKKYSDASKVDGADAPRQAGSTLKPFLYGRAIEKKILTPASLIEDNPTVLKWSGGLYRPKNYDSKFHGTVSVRQALASSLNVPAVKVVRMLKLPETYATVKALNFQDMDNPDTYGASLALGAAEVRLLELANVYRALANDGLMTPVILSHTPKIQRGIRRRLMSPETAFLLKSILSDPNARQIGFGWNSALETGVWTAVKTGTSKALRDNWCVGFSSEYTVAVWAGNFDSTSMRGVSGVTGAAPSWNEIVTYLHHNRKSTPPTPPENIVRAEITHRNGGGLKSEYFLPGTEPKNGVIKKGKASTISFTFPVSGSTLTLNPHKNQDSTKIFVELAGTLPPKTTLEFKGKTFQLKEGQFVIDDIQRGEHVFELFDEKKVRLSLTRFKVL